MARAHPRAPQYPLGRQPLTDMLRHWGRTRPDRPAVIVYGHQTTYAGLDAQSDRCAALLAAHGIGAGDRVAVLMPNCPQFHVVFFGILKLGAVYVPISPLSQRAELQHALADSTPRALIALDQLVPLVRETRAALGTQDPLALLFTTSFADVIPAEPTLPLPPMMQAPRYHGEAQDHAIDLLPAMAACTHPAPATPASLDAVAALNYTGGTTGLPKGCIHTQGDMVDMAAAFGAVSLDIANDSVMLGFFPEFWIAGENLCLIFPAFFGIPLVLLARWDRDLHGGGAALPRHQRLDAGGQRGGGDGAPARGAIRIALAALRGRIVLRQEAQPALSPRMAGADRLGHRRDRLGHDRDPDLQHLCLRHAGR